MQLGLINFLLGIPQGTAGAPGQAGQGSDLFAMLLGDANAQGGGQGGYGALLGKGVNVNALLGQEVDLENLAALNADGAAKLAELLGKEITAGDAKALLAQMEMLGQQPGAHGEAFDQLKESLEAIEAGGEPQKVAELLEQLPVIEGMDSPVERAPVMQRVLSWMQRAFDKSKESPEAVAGVENASDAPGAMLQSLQASMFPAGDTPQEAQGAGEAGDAQTQTVIVPLAAQHLAVVPEWVRKLGQEDTSNPALDEAIAPLALEEDNALPEVNLPKVGAPEKAAPQAAAKEQAAVPNFADQLRPLTASMSDEQAVNAPTTETHQIGGVAGAHAVGASHSTSGHAPTSSTAANPYMHANAPAEQVEVAITQMKEQGLNKITLQLDPVELGRVEVRMEITHDGRTQLSFMVDKPETLEALSRDARALERSLQEAGVKADAGNMQFNLRQQPQFAGDGNSQGGQGHEGREASNDNQKPDVLSSAAGVTKHFTIQVREGLDIHA